MRKNRLGLCPDGAASGDKRFHNRSQACAAPKQKAPPAAIAAEGASYSRVLAQIRRIGQFNDSILRVVQFQYDDLIASFF